MISTIEKRSLRAWPAYESYTYDGWVLRFAEGYTKRANSVNPLSPSTIDLPQKIAYCEKMYADRGLPVVFKLTEASTPDILDRELEKRGYRRLDETVVRILSLCGGRFAQPGIKFCPHLSREWLQAFIRCSGIDDAKTVDMMGRTLHLIAHQAFFAYIQRDERIIACGLGVLERGYLGCFDIVVDRAYRNKGYGRRIMEGLLSEGAKRGAETAYLQVVVGNQPAEKLYDSLGFKEAYRYWYRKK